MSDQCSDPWRVSGEEESAPQTSISPNDMTFGDNFEPYFEPKASTKSAEPLPDSQQYIQSLEKKLEKLKGKTKEMSSKDVMSGLSAKKEAILQQLIDSSHCRDIDIESQTTVVNNSIVYQYLERRLFPQMQAMTEEELQRLLEADVLQRIHKTGTEDSDQRKSNNE